MPANLTFEDLYRIDHSALVMSVGISVSSLFTGGLVVLAILCLCLLSEEKLKSFWRQKVILQSYIIVVVGLDLGLQFTFLLFPHAIAVFHARSSEEAKERLHQTLRIPMGLFRMLVLTFTDGLFIWRCYIMQQSLGLRGRGWHHIFWVIPGCFWVFNQVAGIALLFINDVKPSRFNLLGSLAAATFASNAAINIYATIFICLCLYAHHRAAVASGYGVQVALFQYRYIMNLLLQFAIVTVPIAITTAVALGLRMGRTTFALAMVPIACSSQAFTSVLMIHQVLKARKDTDAHVESIKLVPETSADEVSFREDDGSKPVNGIMDQESNAGYV